MRNIILAYCKDNQNTAKDMMERLNGSGLPIEDIGCDGAKSDNSLGELLKNKPGHVVLLISDNFLRSSQCMYKALLMVQNLNSAGRLLPVITNGQYIDPLTKKVSIVKTSFERVSSVIQYMNFWQEQYLEMRKQKRHLKQEEEADFNERLKVIRSISTEIGEFLRFLRGLDYLTFDQLAHNRFEQLFNRTDNLGLYLDYKNNGALQPELVHEVAAEETSVSGNPGAVSDIPGMDLLSKAEPIINELNNESERSQLIEENEQAEEEEELEEIEEEIEELSLDIDIEGNAGPDAISDHPLEEQVNEESPTPPSQDSLTPPTEENSKESSYELLQSLFDDEEEEDEEGEQEEAAESSSVEAEEEHIDEIVAEIPQRPSVDQILAAAEVHFDDHELERGLDVLKTAINHQPESPRLRYRYAEALLEQDAQSEAAVTELRTLLEKHPKHISAHLRLAEVAEFQQEFIEAHKHYEQVYNIDNAIPGLAYKLGLLTTNFFESEAEKAGDYLKKAIKEDPDHSDARYVYGVLLYERLNKPQKAIKQLEKTLKMKPDHPFANYDLALIYHGEGNRKAASEYYQQSYLINPELRTPENDEAFRYEALKAASSVPATTSTVLITGATAGIGRATAEEFAKNGYRLILTGRRQEKLEALQLAFKTRYNTECECLTFDVRDLDAAKAALNELPEAFKQVDILINNAGLAKGYAPIHEGQLEHWETMIDTNIKGLLYITRIISPQMVKRQKGHIINVCSTAGHEVYPNGNVYCATKYAVDALTKSIRLDLHKHNIRVSQVSPGHVEETEFARVRFDGDTDRAKIYEDFNPLKSKDVAEVIYFMATRPAYVNIQNVLMMGTQQASSNHIHRSGRIFDE
ncbi:MAG: SDR family NAD(P)-dependent oxidoreductase [Bacteroidota bacterium]